MSDVTTIAQDILEQLMAAPRSGRRRLVAIAGPPASGKSTLSEVMARLMTDAGYLAVVVPMDGFHLDNAILAQRGLLSQKGAPETFDQGGFQRLVAALPGGETVYFPVFDRDRDIAIAGGGVVAADCDTVIVEGNYLLYDAPGWRDLYGFWDFSVQLAVPEPVLLQRLVSRWLAHGCPLNRQMRGRGEMT